MEIIKKTVESIPKQYDKEPFYSPNKINGDQ
jgi:hypothetical protein